MSKTVVGKLLAKHEAIVLSKRTGGRVTTFMEAIANQSGVGKFLGYTKIKDGRIDYTVATFQEMMLLLKMEDEESGEVVGILAIPSKSIRSPREFTFGRRGLHITNTNYEFNNIRSYNSARELLKDLQKFKDQWTDSSDKEEDSYEVGGVKFITPSGAKKKGIHLTKGYAIEIKSGYVILDESEGREKGFEVQVLLTGRGRDKAFLVTNSILGFIFKYQRTANPLATSLAEQLKDLNSTEVEKLIKDKYEVKEL